MAVAEQKNVGRVHILGEVLYFVIEGKAGKPHENWSKTFISKLTVDELKFCLKSKFGKRISNLLQN
jgi:hypothetical protein